MGEDSTQAEVIALLERGDFGEMLEELAEASPNRLDDRGDGPPLIFGERGTATTRCADGTRDILPALK